MPFGNFLWYGLSLLIGEGSNLLWGLLLCLLKVLIDALDRMFLLLDGGILFLIQSPAIFREVALASAAEAFILPCVHFSQEHLFLLWGNIEGSIGAASNIKDPMFFHRPLCPIIFVKARFALRDHLYSHRPKESSPGRALSVEVFR